MVATKAEMKGDSKAHLMEDCLVEKRAETMAHEYMMATQMVVKKGHSKAVQTAVS